MKGSVAAILFSNAYKVLSQGSKLAFHPFSKGSPQWQAAAAHVCTCIPWKSFIGAGAWLPINVLVCIRQYNIVPSMLVIVYEFSVVHQKLWKFFGC